MKFSAMKLSARSDLLESLLKRRPTQGCRLIGITTLAKKPSRKRAMIIAVSSPFDCGRVAACAKTARRASVWRRPLYGG